MYKTYTRLIGIHIGYATKFLLFMRLTIVLLIATMLQVTAANTKAQSITYKQKSITLINLFNEIKKQTSYNVIWNEGTLDAAHTIDADFNNTPLEKVLEISLNGQPVAYTLSNKTIVLKTKEPGYLERISNYFAVLNLEGKVVDAETGQGIPKATISLKNTKRLVMANERGAFSFYSLKEDAILVVSNIGYVTQEVIAKQGLVVKLVPASNSLDDVVVSTGYQQVKKASTTGAYTVISAKDIESTPAVNLMERLEGKVPGVQFDLRNNKIQIRGVSSYSARPPLIIIDGFPALDQKLTTVTSGVVDGSLTADLQPTTSGNAVLSSINPADIESITFLKDAAASAIWGANAANGVIVITTKKGVKGKQTINFSTTLSTSAPANFKNMTTMTNAQYIDLEQEMFNLNMVTDPKKDWRNPPVSEAQEWMFKVKRNTATPAQRDSALNVLANRSNTQQLRDNLLQRAMSQQYNLSFSGGGENSSYYISGSYTKDQPVFKSNSGQTYSLMMNLNNDFLNKRLTLSTGMNYNNSKSQVNSAALNALSVGRYGLAPYQMLVDQNGNKIYSAIAVTTAVGDSLVRNNKQLPWGYSAIDELNYNNAYTTLNSIRVNSSLKGQITDWLNLTLSGQYQKAITDQYQIQSINSYSIREQINTGNTYINGRAAYGFPKGGLYTGSNKNQDDYGLRAQLNVNKNWNEKNHFDFLAGTEIRQQKGTGYSTLLYGYNEETSTSTNVNTSGTQINYPSIFGGSKSLRAPNGTILRSTRRYLSYFSNATYSYLGKYYITGSMRFDDINLLGVDRRDRAAPLWSGGLRWDIKKEDFMKKLDWINSLSLRATLGTAGSPPQSSANYTTISVGQVDSYNQLPYATISVPANQDIGWETTKTVNFGLDAGLFDNRVSMQLDVYNKHTTDIIMSLPLNSTYGYSQLSYNSGDLSGHGIELNLSGEIFREKKWGWTSSFNLSYNTNTVTDVRFPNKLVTGGTSATITGYSVDNLFVYRWAGLDNKGQSQIYAANGSIIPASSTAALKTEDLAYAGRTTAPYFGGFMNTFSYKELSLSVRATYYLGHKFLYKPINAGYYPQGGTTTGYSGLLGNNAAMADRWRKPGDELFTNIPGIVNNNLNTLDRFMNSDLNVRDAGSIRLQQISLSYRLPKELLRATSFIKGITVGATVSNLGLIWVANKEGIDPDYQATSAFNNLPPTRNYVLNFNLSL